MDCEELERRAATLEARKEKLDALEQELQRREQALAERLQLQKAAEEELEAGERSLGARAPEHSAETAKAPKTLLHAAKRRGRKKYDTGVLERIASETPTPEQQEHYQWYEDRLELLTEERGRLYTELMRIRRKVHELRSSEEAGALDRLAAVAPGLKSFSETAARKDTIRNLQDSEGELLAVLRRVVTEVMTVTRWLEKHDSWRQRKQPQLLEAPER